jgi:uncharacterized protein YjiK
MTLCVSWRAALVWAVLAGGGISAVPGQERTDGGIGLDKYRLVRGPIRITQLSDNASGLTFSPVSGTLFVAVDSPPSIVELDLDGRLRRMIDMAGFQDLEGIAHWKDKWFAVVEERRYRLCLVAIDASTARIDHERVPQYQLETKTGDNSGLEGVAIDAAGNRFYCVKEKRPKKIYQFPAPAARDAAIRPTQPWSIPDAEDGGLDDLSGMHFDRRTGHLLILSDESVAVVEYTADGKEVARLSLEAESAGLKYDIPKAEGITMDADGRLYICSEPNLLFVFSK